MSKTIFLETPATFSFRQTIYSHGWSELLPFEIDAQNWRLSYVFTGENLKNPISATISDDEGKLKIEISGEKIASKTEANILSQIRHVLRLDDDLSGFYKSLKSEKRLNWIAEKRAGRLLRSPTVFEDLVKTICTTNCSWSLTKKMVSNLVEKLGEESKDGKRAFPTAEAMANVSAEFYRDEIRAGYRSSYFAELAEKVAVGKINPESWLDSRLTTKELTKEMTSVKAVGDHASENLLTIVGRHDAPALD